MTSIQAVRSPATHSIKIVGRLNPEYKEVLSTNALRFIGRLSRRFECRRRELLRARVIRQSDLDNGWKPSFSDETAWIRDADWVAKPAAQHLIDRRVQIGGPVDRQSVIDALTSGANVFMADFEDGNSPTWDNELRGQINLRDALRGTIAYEDDRGGYHRLGTRTAQLAVRPRGWHMLEHGLLVDNRPVSATLFDVGLFLFHNAQQQAARDDSPHLCLPKVESYFEARLWHDVLSEIEQMLSIPSHTIRTTVLVENILAAFQMDEILFELRDRVCALQFGRWDYLFSFVCKFRLQPDFVLPDRNQCTMRHRALRAVLDLMIATCHRRGIHAIGGKAARVPSATNRDEKHELFEQLMRDLRREASSGLDGTQVAHPHLVHLAKGIFETAVRGPHQIARKNLAAHVSVDDLLAVPLGPKTRQALEANIDISIRYLAAWLGGCGNVAVEGVVENMATAELARAQVWQWITHDIRLDSGEDVTRDLVRTMIQTRLEQFEKELGEIGARANRYTEAASLTEKLMTSRHFLEHVTTIASPRVTVPPHEEPQQH